MDYLCTIQCYKYCIKKLNEVNILKDKAAISFIAAIVLVSHLINHWEYGIWNIPYFPIKHPI